VAPGIGTRVRQQIGTNVGSHTLLGHSGRLLLAVVGRREVGATRVPMAGLLSGRSRRRSGRCIGVTAGTVGHGCNPSRRRAAIAQPARYPDRVTVPLFGDPVPDILGEGYQALTVDLPEDDEGPVQATVVRHRAPRPTSRAVLYMHGFADYFFHTELAEFHAARGENFYAIDLRKYGRSLRPHQTPYRMTDVTDYYPELDATLALIAADGHDRLIVNAHSTGGLIAALWLHDRPAIGGERGPVQALVLNSPLLEQPAGWAVRTLAARPIMAVARSRPLAVIPSFGPSFYNQSIHRSARGHWDFVQEWKPVAGGIVHASWVAGTHRGIVRLHAGLGLDLPILVMCSAKTVRARQWTEDFYAGDGVLDADAIARWCTRLGTHVTCIRIDGGMHDLLLSRPEVRERVFAEMARWLHAYAPAVDAAARLVDDRRPGSHDR